MHGLVICADCKLSLDNNGSISSLSGDFKIASLTPQVIVRRKLKIYLIVWNTSKKMPNSIIRTVITRLEIDNKFLHK